MWKKLKKLWQEEPKTAIRVSRQYNGINYKHEYVINPESKTKKILSHVKEHCPNYQQQEIERYKLKNAPSVRIREGTYGHIKDALIVAAIDYSLKLNERTGEQPFLNNINGFSILKGLGIVWIAGAAVLFLKLLSAF